MYGYPASGYVMSAGGAPVAIPMQAMQAGASGAAAQGYHQPMVLVPVSGAAGGQQLIAGGIVTGTLQQQQMEAGMSHSFVHSGGYAAKPNEQVCLILSIVRWKMQETWAILLRKKNETKMYKIHWNLGDESIRFE